MLLAALLVAGTFFWLGRRDTAVSGPPELIHAPPGPYKIKPPNPGGLDIAGESETAFETSAGEDKDAQLDLSKVPEEPVAKPPKAEPKPRRLDRPKAPRQSRTSPEPQADRSRPEASSSSAPSPTRRRPSARGPALSARFPSIAA